MTFVFGKERVKFSVASNVQPGRKEPSDLCERFDGQV